MSPEAPALPFELAGPYALAGGEKRVLLLRVLNALHDWHALGCAGFGAATRALFPPGEAATLEDLPYLPVRLFKSLELLSVPRSAILKTLVSSGTTGHAPSRIFLDRETSVRQSRALAAIMTSFLGSRRLPMVVADSLELLQDRTRFNARAAALLGFSVHGRDHFHALDGALQLDVDALAAWLAVRADTPVFLFGFTAIVWQSVVQALARAARPLRFPPGSLLLHGGGWKRLADQQVDNVAFRSAVRQWLGIERVFNYYGMVEQVGSIFMECEHGHLHAPVFADVIVRDPLTLRPLPAGQVGVLQVLSALPLSYPGHSLLTEDLGVLHGEDDCACGRRGRHFGVQGRMPEAELRGCSDTRVLP